MDLSALKIYRKLKQLKASLDLKMSAMLPPKDLDVLPPSQIISSSGSEVPEQQDEHQDLQSTQDNHTNEGTKHQCSTEDSRNLSEVLQAHLPDIKMVFEKWGESFKECENVENLYPRRLDDIIKDAKCLEQQLILQKESLKERLRFLTRTLASTPPEGE